MGINIDGGMIVGCRANDIEFGDDYDCATDYAENNNLDYYSLWFDAGDDGIVLGYCVEDVDPLSESFDEWIKMVKSKAEKFKELTGCNAKLIGMQDVW